jgi:hypothetical protein
MTVYIEDGLRALYYYSSSSEGRMKKERTHEAISYIYEMARYENRQQQGSKKGNDRTWK